MNIEILEIKTTNELDDEDNMYRASNMYEIVYKKEEGEPHSMYMISENINRILSYNLNNLINSYEKERML